MNVKLICFFLIILWTWIYFLSCIEEADETISDDEDEDEDEEENENNTKNKNNKKKKNVEKKEKATPQKNGMVSKISCYLATVDGELYGKCQADGK